MENLTVTLKAELDRRGIKATSKEVSAALTAFMQQSDTAVRRTKMYQTVTPEYCKILSVLLEMKDDLSVHQ